MKKIKIANRVIGEGEPCFIIAEAGVNHNGELELAKKLVDAAKRAGADAVKFQTWKTDEIITKEVPMAGYQQKTKTNEQNQYELIKKLELSKSDFKKLKEYCEKVGIIFLSTPGDKDSADFLDELGVAAFKIGSDDLTNTPLLEHVAKKRKPIIISTGMGTLEEVREAAVIVENVGNFEICLLHCTSEYPTPFEDVNLRAMETLKQFNYPVGYSDHTLGIAITEVAAAMGAAIIEKHFTIDKNLPGPDQKMSLDPEELEKLVKSVREVQGKGLQSLKMSESELKKILGSKEKKPTASELKNIKFLRKKLVASKNIKSGTKIAESVIGVKRTEKEGLEPGAFYSIIGKTAKLDIKKDEVFTEEKLE